MISESQVFECPHCGDTITTNCPSHIDQVEGDRCESCDFGYYQWIGPAEFIEEQASGVPALDDIEDDEIDAEFEQIIDE
jgi:hypothetical protein